MIDAAQVNERLQEIGQQLYGSKVTLRVVDPKTIRLLKKNARFMKKATFDQLTANLKRDGALESVPLCHTVEGELECVSGNHRVQAAVKAGIDLILVFVVPYELPKDEKIAKQLSHNALSGQDDMTILSELWGEIESLQEKLYAGLDSELIGELEKIKFQGFAAEPIRTESITLWFLPEEVEAMDKLVKMFQDQAAMGQVYMAPLSHYDKMFKALVNAKKNASIKNTAVAFMLLIDELAKVQSAGSSGEPGDTLPGGSFEPTPALQIEVEEGPDTAKVESIKYGGVEAPFTKKVAKKTA